MAAKKKPVQTLTLADLTAVDTQAVGGAGATTIVVDFETAPPRGAGVIVKDEGEGGVAAAAFLAERKFI
jgi:electron transfer flavoprotein beta subunit